MWEDSDEARWERRQILLTIIQLGILLGLIAGLGWLIFQIVG